MPGKARAVRVGKVLQNKVVKMGRELSLEIKTEVRLGKRIWGANRRIDVVMTDPKTRLSLGIECKAQRSMGTTEEKLTATVRDIKAWPIRGIIVIDGEGFSDHMRSFLYSTGLTVDLEDLEMWLRLFFGISS